ncbi:UNVERIFIED_CONTAM: hypothetical protein Slati_1036600 [Sesamum latifolium]|uniref:Uncharacterized protein n=1 Tax=Sesamum latifolium TaxID=2727402 RepID=A0AAW2XV36_9LAMI
MAERFCVTRKVAPWPVGYQGQHLSGEWVIEASTPRPCDPTRGMHYWVLATHGVRWLRCAIVGRRCTVGNLRSQAESQEGMLGMLYGINV